MSAQAVRAEELVAHYLRSRGYNGALESFIREAGLSPKIGQGLDSSWTLERILQEKQVYDLTVNFEVTSLADNAAEWRQDYPADSVRIPLEPAANILQVALVTLRSESNGHAEQVLLVSTAARQLYRVKLSRDKGSTWSPLNLAPDSPILSFVVFAERYIIFTTISGGVAVYDTITNGIIAKRKDHQKYAVQIILASHEEQTYIATIGWDSRLILYAIPDANDTFTLTEPVVTLQLSSVPESITFATNQQTGTVYLVLGRRDATYLHYYQLVTAAKNATPPATALRFAGKQNLSPYSTSWNAFAPAFLAICPTDPTLLAIATNSTPHMKVLLVRMLFPELSQLETSAAPAQDSSPPSTVAAPAVEATPIFSDGHQTIDPREVAAIITHTNTNISQTRYSTPVIAWRPDGTGFWVNSEEGTIKGIDRAGKIKATLQGHEYATKVRCLWAGVVDSLDTTQADTEVLISGGFDQKLILWQASDPAS